LMERVFAWVWARMASKGMRIKDRILAA
jgi:hypothetical protein